MRAGPWREGEEKRPAKEKQRREVDLFVPGPLVLPNNFSLRPTFHESNYGRPRPAI